jgi:hypothetical protein
MGEKVARFWKTVLKVLLLVDIMLEALFSS